MTRTGELSARIVTDLAGWDALKPWWDILLEASPDSTPWQNWDYLRSWWENLRGRRKLRIIVVERAGVPVMIFPLQITREYLLCVPRRLIEPISMMWDVNRPRFAIGASDPVAFRRGLEILWDIRNEWDAIRIEELPLEDSQAQELKALAARRDLRFRGVLSSVCPHLDIDQSWSQFLGSRGPRLKKNLRASLRKLEARGTVRLEVSETEEEVARAFDTALRLHRSSWKHKKRVGLSQSPAFRQFFWSFLIKSAARGRARVLILRVAERPVAATIAFIHLDTYFSTEIVHDAAFARCSPGTLLESMELERLMNERRLRHYDFLGRFLNNKQRWTEAARVTYRFYVFKPGLANALLDRYYFRVKPIVKRVWRFVFGLSKVTAQATRFAQRVPDGPCREPRVGSDFHS